MRTELFSLVIGLGCAPGCASKSNEADVPAAASPGPENAKPAEPDPGQGKAFPVEAVSFEAADGVEIFGDFYGVEQDKPRPLILLFHQAGSNAGEYASIGPRLQALGYNALAIDQRSGDERWDRKNRTVGAFGKSTSYLEAYPDLEAALAWGQKQGYPRIMAWGSSYTAALVFKLAADHGDALHAILSFSPGEYIQGEEKAVSGWASAVKIPIYATSAAGDEVDATKEILAAAPAAKKTQHEPAHGVHGSSTLLVDSNADGVDANWKAVEAFLADVAP